MEALNIGFFVVHTIWTLFNCVGWIWRRTRPWHLATLTVTAASWFGLGLWYGWGYCPCTDWHWQVRERLGYVDPPSYTQLLIRELTPLDPSASTANAITLGVFLTAIVLNLLLTARDLRQRRAGRRRGA
ncbi:MAG TPA: DUF2784 family protein [Methylomirabilota bacterium]